MLLFFWRFVQFAKSARICLANCPGNWYSEYLRSFFRRHALDGKRKIAKACKDDMETIGRKKTGVHLWCL